jgi:hypothetical protein
MATRLGRMRFVREAMQEKADLSALRVRPTPRVRAGLVLIGISYIIGWPAVGLLALIAYHTAEPLVIAVGGPVIYGLSHAVFMVGSWLAGASYAAALIRWVTRKIMGKLEGAAPPAAS